MTDCPYCLEVRNHYINTELDSNNQVEVEVVACKEPYLMVRYFNDGLLANWNIGVQIKYCPMCGRRLTGG